MAFEDVQAGVVGSEGSTPFQEVREPLQTADPIDPSCIPNYYPTRGGKSQGQLANRLFLPFVDNTIVANSPEMYVGNKPTYQPRRLGPRIAQPFFGWVDVVITPEMFGGNVPTRSRKWLAPRIPLPISQTTHVQATFTPDMVQGNEPQRNRQYQGKQFGLTIMENDTAVTASVATGGGYVFALGIGDMISENVMIGEF